MAGEPFGKRCLNEDGRMQNAEVKQHVSAFCILPSAFRFWAGTCFYQLVPGAIRSGQISSVTPYLDTLPKSSTPPTVAGRRKASLSVQTAPLKKNLSRPFAGFLPRLRLFFKAFSSLRFRLAAVIFVAIAPALG